MKLPCGCPTEIACFHGPCIPRRSLKWGLSKLIENAHGKIRLADPKDLIYHPDGSVCLREL